MFDSILIPVANELVRWLLVPVLTTLLCFVALSIWETGVAFGERFGGLARLRATTAPSQIERYGRRRIERADILARLGPMIGLAGTLIPLGPGIAALSRGELTVLAQAVSVAFDTTVIGLLVGVLGFVLGKLRRRWYDEILMEREATHAPA